MEITEQSSDVCLQPLICFRTIPATPPSVPLSFPRCALIISAQSSPPLTSPTHCHSPTLLSASLFLSSTDERAYPWQLDRGGDWKAGSWLLLYMAGAVRSGSLSFQPP